MGIWEWGFLYKEIRNRAENASEEYLSTPNTSPVHAGGLIAVSRDYFLTIGGYDPGLLVWGGEQFELSFKVIFYSLFDIHKKVYQGNVHPMGFRMTPSKILPSKGQVQIHLRS